jgi:hypothetical protein
MSESFYVKFGFSSFKVLKNEIFELPHPIFFFLHFYDYIPGPLIEQNWIPSPKDNVYQVYFYSFAINSHLERDNSLRLIKPESTFPKDDLCRVCLKLAQWIWRRRLLKDPTLFSHFCNYPLFEEGMILYLKGKATLTTLWLLWIK